MDEYSSEQYLAAMAALVKRINADPENTVGKLSMTVELPVATVTARDGTKRQVYITVQVNEDGEVVFPNGAQQLKEGGV